MDRVNVVSLEVVAGPMFAGKTSELIRLVEREVYAKKHAGIFKPSFDTRYSAKEVVTHNGLRYSAFVVPADKAGISKIRSTSAKANLNVVAVDEIQFFPMSIVKTCVTLADDGKRVIVSGLNLNFRGEPFPTTLEFLSIADKVVFLTAVCVICGGEASRTQRLIGGKPAPKDSPIVVIGGKELYEPRCRTCYQPPA